MPTGYLICSIHSFVGCLPACLLRGVGLLIAVLRGVKNFDSV